MYIGEFAAIGTAVFWAFSSLFFTLGGNRVGAECVNLVRLYFGLLFIVIVQIYTTGQPTQWSVESWRHLVLFASAFVGLVIGDAALFYSFLLIGPRLAMLVMSTVPVFSAIFALLCFGEALNFVEGMAILAAIVAIGYVVAEDRGSKTRETEQTSNHFKGVMFALVGALGQTGNLIITKYALVDDFSTLTATQIRIFYSIVILTLWAICRGQLGTVVRKLADLKATLFIAVGALVGPFIGIWLSYIAINNTKIAIASVIMALPPVLLIPIAWYWLGEKATRRSIIGTLLAVIAIGVLLVVKSS